MRLASKSVLASIKLSAGKKKANDGESNTPTGPTPRHCLVDYAPDDEVFGARIVAELESQGWRVFDPSRGRKILDVNATISRGVQVSDVCICLVSSAFVESKREMKLANFVNQKKMPLIFILVGELKSIPTGALGIILADAEQADSASTIGSKISSLLGPDKAEMLRMKVGEKEIALEDESESMSDSIFSGKEVVAAYWQFGRWHDVSFSFFSLSVNGEVIGQGDDVVGAFTVSGMYTMPKSVSKGILGGTKNVPGTIKFTKSYIGQHVVLYDGALALSGQTLSMEGTWTIEGYDSDAFRMTLLASASLTNERAADVNGADVTSVVYECAACDLGLVDRLARVLDEKFAIRQANNGSETIATKIAHLQAADALVVVLSKEFEQSADARKLLTFADKSGKPIIPIHTSASYTQGKETAVICAGLLYTVLDPKSFDKRAVDVANQILKATAGRTQKATEEVIVDSRNVRGWYEAQGGYYPMQFDSLRLTSSTVAGQGTDFVGEFVLSGSAEVGDRSVKFEKQYLGQHTLQYEGEFERHTMGVRIKGIWYEATARDNTGKFEVEALEGSVGQTLPMLRSHAFVSYCWAEQEFVKRVADELRRLNIPLFFDIAGDMANNINESMADGVDNAYVFLCFASKGYARSKNCKKEFSYARQRNKRMVALVLDENLAADNVADWLASALAAVDRLPAKVEGLGLTEDVLKQVSELVRDPSTQASATQTSALNLGPKILRLPSILPRRVVLGADSSFRSAGVDERGSFTAMGQMSWDAGSQMIQLHLSKDYVLDPALGDANETVMYDLDLAKDTKKVAKGVKHVRTTKSTNECTENSEVLTILPELFLDDASLIVDELSVPPDPTKVSLKAEYYQSGWHPMVMEMFSMSKGVVLAQGDDPVGPFTCAGAYNEPDAKGIATISFVKQYVGAHSVRYVGKASSISSTKEQRKIIIEGTWTIGPSYSDKFRIQCIVAVDA